MKKIILVFIMLIPLMSCQSPAVNKKDSNKWDLVKVEIVNHTPNHSIKKEVEIVKNSDVVQIENQLVLIKSVSNINLKANKGLYAMTLYKKDGTTYNFDIVYTTYNGVVIFDELTNKTYTNDQLENLVTDFLQ